MESGHSSSGRSGDRAAISKRAATPQPFVYGVRRTALTKDLPRVRVEYDLTEVEKDDFETVTRIGEDKSETLDYIPARLQVIEHVRAKYAATRKADGGQPVVSAAMPPAPLPKSNHQSLCTTA